MKYIKTYKQINEGLEVLTAKQVVNMELLGNLKDLSLDYLDKGMTLSYSVYIDFEFELPNSNQTGNILLYGLFSHEEDELVWEVPEDEPIAFTATVTKYNSHAPSLWYEFAMHDADTDFSDGEPSINRDATNEIFRTIIEMYPDENIDTRDPY